MGWHIFQALAKKELQAISHYTFSHKTQIFEGEKNTTGVGFAWKFPKSGFFAKKGTYLTPSEHKRIRKTRIYLYARG
jgi:hypothetical protein